MQGESEPEEMGRAMGRRGSKRITSEQIGVHREKMIVKAENHTTLQKPGSVGCKRQQSMQQQPQLRPEKLYTGCCVEAGGEISIW